MKRVLLADDSVAARKSIQTILEMAGIDVVAVGNGDLALARLDEVSPHMVLLDAIMPGRSGYEVCAEIKKDATRSGLPVLLVTTEFEPYDDRAAADAGADGHLIKPLSSEAISRMRDVWSRYAPADADRLADVGDRVDTDDLPQSAEPATEAPAPFVPGPEAFITGTMKAPDLAAHAAASAASANESRDDKESGRPSPLPDHVVEAVEPRGARVGRSSLTTESLESEPIEADDGPPSPPGTMIGSVELGDLQVVAERCPCCGVGVAGGDIFCLSCGAMVLVTPEEADVAARTTFCSGCRHPLMPGEVFCPSCGDAV